MLEEPIGKYLSMAHRAHATLLNQKLVPYNLGYGQIFLLITLYNQEGICQQTICEMYNLNKAAVGRGIKKLEKQDLITKETDPQDNRRQLIYLTDKAREFKPKFEEILTAVETEIRQDLTKEEIKTFLQVSQKIYSNLKSELDDS
ncbi:MarR family winged helix-turn-helix transcriptional regulator [Halanaerobaculum tunisiense]